MSVWVRFHIPKVCAMFQLPEVQINEAIFLDFGDDGAEALRSIPLLLRIRGRAVPVLSPS